MDVREKLNILQNKYHLPLTAEIEKEVSEMCTYTASVLERGLDQGRAEGRAEGRTIAIFQCVQDGDFGIRRGAEKLGIPESEFISRMQQAGYRIPESTI
jgi:3-oxoacyl-[acyl-carrier-protein] synthase III